MRNKILALLVVGVFATLVKTARGADLETIDDKGRILLTGVAPSQQFQYRFNYPGIMSGFVLKGVIKNVLDAPDCLIVHQNLGPMNEVKVQQFLSQIEVRNGYQILAGQNLAASLLSATQVNGTFVYYLSDFSRFLTGIDVRTKDQSKTFTQVAEEMVGEEVTKHGIGMTLSRGCRLVLQ